MSRRQLAGQLRWWQVHWQRPLDPDHVVGVLRQWAADQRSQPVVLEARADSSGIAYFLGTPTNGDNLLSPLKPLGVLTEVDADTRQAMTAAVALKASTRHRPLRAMDLAAASRTVLTALADLRDDEQLVLQIILGPRRVPLAVPNQSPSSVVMPWWQVAWIGNGGQVDGEKRTALRTKVGDHGYACTIRLGAKAASKQRSSALLLNLLSGLRTSEAAGLKLTLAAQRLAAINRAGVPWRWPIRLNVTEVAVLSAWPVGEDDLPGQPALHPALLPPPVGTTGKQRVIAKAAAPGFDASLAQPVAAALHHTHVIGPTGTGKSTALLGLISQDIADGRSVVVVEPKGDLVADVLARMPEHRRGDVVILDPSDKAPVGLNPLLSGGRRPEVVADGVLSTIKQLYGRDIGPRSQDILYASLLTLAMKPDASLVMLPLLLTNPSFRRSMTAGIRDPLTLEPFWAAYEQYSEQERANVIAPLMNKLRPLLRPGLRSVIGQRDPRFDIREVFTQRKILLVPLQRGVIGAEAASLLGSLLVGELWQASQARVTVPAERRHPVMVYVDEVQDYLHLPTDLGEALAQARGLGVGFTLAHQYLSQLPQEMAKAVLANARSRITFQLPHADAAELAKGHPEISVEDFTSLGQYEIYASLYANGKVMPYASGRTMAPAEPTVDVTTLRRLSRERYGQPLWEIEDVFAALLKADGGNDEPTGRRRRSAA